MGFQDLNVSKQILMALEEAGFENPTPIQEEVFSVSRSGRDLIGIAQTGTGKTLAYLIPMLMKLHYAQGLVPRALVIVPTRELVVQVCESVELLTEFMDIRCVGVYGGTNIRTQQDRVFEGVDLLVATPGRFMDIYYNGIIRTKMIKTVVVDEADRLMDLGFLPQLKGIFEVLPEKHQTMLFSATFSEAVESLSHDFLNDPVRVEVTPVSSTVDTVDQCVYFVEKPEKKGLLISVLKKESDQSVLVFSRTKHGADNISRTLKKAGIQSEAIHGNKSQGQRQRALSDFKSGKIKVMVATDIAARGIDIHELNLVINYDLPDVAETYVHRIGRTGRAGHTGRALTFCTSDEQVMVKDIQKLTGRKLATVRHTA